MILMRKGKSGQTTYRAKVYVDGRQITKTFKRKRDAELWKQQMVVDRERGVLKLDAKKDEIPSFREFQERWYSTKSMSISMRTQEGYRAILDVHILPFLGEKKLDQITINDGHDLIGKLKAKGKNPKGVNLVLGLLKAILGDAVKWEILELNRKPFCKNVLNY
jgi:hypothetical protein